MPAFTLVFTKQFLPDLHRRDVEQHNLQCNKLLNKKFKADLSSISSGLHYLDANGRQTANLFSRKQLISVLKRIKKDLSNSGDAGKVLSELTRMIQLLTANDSVHLNIKEKAKISLSFDKILVEWKKSLGEKIAVNVGSGTEHRRQQWIIKIITAIIDDLQLCL